LSRTISGIFTKLLAIHLLTITCWRFFLLSCHLRKVLRSTALHRMIYMLRMCRSGLWVKKNAILLYNTQLPDITTGIAYCSIVSVICNALILLVEFHFITVSFIVCNALKFFLIIIGWIFDGFMYPLFATWY